MKAHCKGNVFRSKTDVLHVRLCNSADTLQTKACKEYAHKPLPCEVISINYEKLHYRVKFGCGLTETFKVPEVREYT